MVQKSVLYSFDDKAFCSFATTPNYNNIQVTTNHFASLVYSNCRPLHLHTLEMENKAF